MLIRPVVNPSNAYLTAFARRYLQPLTSKALQLDPPASPPLWICELPSLAKDTSAALSGSPTCGSTPEIATSPDRSLVQI